MAETIVKFWEVVHGQIKYRRAACFGNLSFNLPSRLVYLIPIDDRVTTENALFYLNFLDNILDKSIYRYKMIGKSKHWSKNQNLMLTIKTGGLARAKALLYLTAFRYLDEYPEIIGELVKFKNVEDLSELFNIFLKIHFDYNTIPNRKNGNLSGHGLMCFYFDHKQFAPISLNEFKQNLELEDLKSVNLFFKNKPILGDRYKDSKFSYTKLNFPIDKPLEKI